MKFEEKYKQCTEILLTDIEKTFDHSIKGLLQTAAANKELGGGNTIRQIMECCTSQVDNAVLLLVDSFAEMVEVYDEHISNDRAWKVVSPYIDGLISLSENKKMKAMKTAQNHDLNDSLLNASSIEDKYKLIKSEAEFKLVKAMSGIKTKRGSTLKDRILNRLNNNWFYLILVLFFTVLAWIKNG